MEADYARQNLQIIVFCLHFLLRSHHHRCTGWTEFNLITFDFIRAKVIIYDLAEITRFVGSEAQSNNGIGFEPVTFGTLCP